LAKEGESMIKNKALAGITAVAALLLAACSQGSSDTAATADEGTVAEATATFCPPGEKLVGHDQISTFYDASGEAFPGLKVDILHEVRNGDESCIEWYATLTDKAGNVFNIPGVNVIKIRDGKFESVHAYFDPTVLKG